VVLSFVAHLLSSPQVKTAKKGLLAPCSKAFVSEVVAKMTLPDADRQLIQAEVVDKLG